MYGDERVRGCASVSSSEGRAASRGGNLRGETKHGLGGSARCSKPQRLVYASNRRLRRAKIRDSRVKAAIVSREGRAVSGQGGRDGLVGEVGG